MNAAPCSWRVVTCWICVCRDSASRTSIVSSPGTEKTYSQPSAARQSTTRSAARRGRSVGIGRRSCIAGDRPRAAARGCQRHSQGCLSRSSHDRRRGRPRAPPVHPRSQRSRMKTKIVAVLVLAAIGVGAIYVSLGGFPAQAASATEYLTAAAITGDVTDDVAATGTIESAESNGLVFGAAPYLVTDSSTSPQVSATYPVTKVDVKVGDTVKKGQVLATASTTDLEQQVATARNNVASARVSLNAANDARTTANSSGNTDQIRQAKIGQLNAKN